MSNRTFPADAAPGTRSHAGWTRSALAHAVLIVFFIYFLAPLMWLIVSSTKSIGDMLSTFGLWFGGSFHLFSNIHDVFAYDGNVYVHWLWNTAYYATTCAVGASLIATLSGYAFAKFRFPGRRTLFAIILGAIMVPNTALVVPLYLLLSKVGLINTPFAVILPLLVNPFGVYLMRVFAEQAVPDELLDAARIDGASEFRAFVSVALRILMPGFVTILLFSFVGTWNNYFLPLLVLSKPDFYPLTVGLASWNAQATSDAVYQVLYAMVVTGSLISIVPLIAAFLLLQRYWQGGLTFGSLKS